MPPFSGKSVGRLRFLSDYVLATLKMKAGSPSEMSAITTQPPLCHSPRDVHVTIAMCL